MQNHARVGGVLSIISGALGVFWLMIVVFFLFLMTYVFGESYYYYDYGTPDEFYIFVLVFYGIIGLLYTLACVLAIAGGVLALRRKYWGWALAGSIGATLAFFPCGIPAIIFVSLGKPEFEATGLPVPAAPITG